MVIRRRPIIYWSVKQCTKVSLVVSKLFVGLLEARVSGRERWRKRFSNGPEKSRGREKKTLEWRKEWQENCGTRLRQITSQRQIAGYAVDGAD
jgi:hypothetical protein